jgi:REP element-mobilizing transposase RayT
MKINYVNADHVHALVDLPTAFSIEELMQLLKGSSSHWINANDIVTGNLLGAEAMARSLSQNRTWIRSYDTLHIRKNIIACVRSQKNCEGSSTATGYSGKKREAVKTAVRLGGI